MNRQLSITRDKTHKRVPACAYRHTTWFNPQWCFESVCTTSLALCVRSIGGRIILRRTTKIHSFLDVFRFHWIERNQIAYSAAHLKDSWSARSPVSTHVFAVRTASLRSKYFLLCRTGHLFPSSPRNESVVSRRQPTSPWYTLFSCVRILRMYQAHGNNT